jgi:multiple sugar transport system substrate-binding protein
MAGAKDVGVGAASGKAERETNWGKGRNRARRRLTGGTGRGARVRKYTRRGFLKVAGAGAAGTVLLGAAGCGGGPQNNPAVQAGGSGDGGKTYDGPKVSLAFWNGFTGGDGPFMRQMVEQFNSEHGNIDVSVNTVIWEDYYQKVPVAVRSGEGPDVAIMHIDALGTNAARGVISPLDDVADALKLKEEDFFTPVWNAGIYNGSRYGIPLDISPFGLYYNKTVMRQAGLDENKPPQTRDEFMGALQQMKEAGVQGYWVQPQNPIGSWLYQTMLYQFGGSLFNEEVTQATWNSDAGVEAMTFLTDLIKEGYSPPNVNGDAEFVAFTNNKNGLMMNGIWNINPLKEVPNLEWGAAPLPQLGSEKASWGNSHNFTITNKRGQDPNKVQASKVFINWISSNSLEWAKAGQVPARTSVRKSSEFENLKEQSEIAKIIPGVTFPPSLPGSREVIVQTLDSAANAALLLKEEPKAALDAAAEEANKLLEENRQKYQA